MNQTIDGQASTSREQNSQPVPVDHVDLGRQLSVSGHRHLEVLDLTGDPEAWRCPVCLDLLHKPCVLRCGHVMCFWCMHFAMSPFTQSKCPLCREPYIHLPGVCALLDKFLKSAFPSDHARRALETRDDEAKYGIGAAAEAQQLEGRLIVQEELQPMQEGAFKAEDFACSCWPIHDRVLSGGMHIPVSPVVLNCGHVHCGLCTIDPASSAARLHHCVPSWDVMDSCPQCHDPIFAAPTAVAQLDALVQKLFPAEHAQRMAELQASDWMLTAWSSQHANSPAPWQPTGAHDQLIATLASRLRRPVLASPNALRLPAPPASTEGADVSRSMTTLLTDRFVHYRIGCDGCGVYPIVGKRYRCRDCHERIGFDLCSACHDSNRDMAGRFNQQHRPGHIMELVHNSPSLLHILQATNPTLDPEQLRSLVAMSTEGGAHAEAVQNLLELPLAASMRSAVPLGSARSSGSMERTSSGRRRRASSSTDEARADGSEMASPPRRRRRNNEAYVCIFAPPSDSGQRPHVAVAVYTRSSERNASGSDSGPADALAAMVGQHPPNSGADGPQTNEASDGQLSGEQIAGYTVGQGEAGQHVHPEADVPESGVHEAPDRIAAQRQPLLRRLWTWATRPRWAQTSSRAP